MSRRFICTFLVVLFLAGALPREGFADPPAGAVQSTLYFGLALSGGGTVSERDWTRFLAEIVTPRCPDGLTVVDAYGQWRDPALADAPIVREATKIVIVVHGDTPEAAAALANIKIEYMDRFGQKSVFHTDAPVRIVE